MWGWGSFTLPWDREDTHCWIHRMLSRDSRDQVTLAFYLLLNVWYTHFKYNPLQIKHSIFLTLQPSSGFPNSVCKKKHPPWASQARNVDEKWILLMPSACITTSSMVCIPDVHVYYLQFSSLPLPTSSLLHIPAKLLDTLQSVDGFLVYLQFILHIVATGTFKKP